MKTGTCYFPSWRSAVRYYRPQEGAATVRAVDRKIEAGEIHIGKPTLKPGQVLTIEDNRYFITDRTP